MALFVLLLLILTTYGSLAKQYVIRGDAENGNTKEPEDNTCPDWLHPSEVNSTQTCQCLPDIMHCNSSTQEAAILDCYCMTAGESNSVEVGKCIYNCEHTDSAVDPVYTTLPHNISALKNHFCSHFNRQGRLCGKCEKDHYPPVYSYNLKCMKCTGYYHWITYIAVAFVPLTIFFILVVCLRISATSPQLRGFIIVAQTLAAPPNLRVVLLALKRRQTTTLVASVLTSLYGIWNLDFFRMLIPDICLHVNTLQALALDYVLAVYPLILTVICYITLQLYACNFRIIARLLRPFDTCFTHIRNQIDARTSFIDAFATFLLLSYCKLISVSFDLLVPTQVYNISGHKIGLYLYYDASIEYFGKQHLPYAILAMVIGFAFILLPLILLLVYPMRRFQRLLGKSRMQLQALRIFIDSFQGCYKDGTDGKRDCRYFPAIYLSTRIFLFIAYGLTLNITFYGIATITFMILGIMVVIAQPYKQELSTYNTVEAVHILLLAMWFVSVLCINIVTLKAGQHIKGFFAFSTIVGILPIIYISFVALKWIFTRDKVQTKLKKILPFYKRNQYEELQGNDSFLEGIDQRNEF